MDKKRLEDMQNILDLNDSVDKLYKKLAELEIEGKQKSDEYKEYIEIINFATKRCEKYLNKYTFNDTEINSFISLLIDMNRYNEYTPFEFIEKRSNTKIVRFLEHVMELSLIHHQSKEMDYEREDGVYIDGEMYDFETGISILESTGQMDVANDVRALQEQAVIEEATDRFLDDLAIAKMELESHTFMLYLIDRINEEKIPQVKEGLIRMKYQIISNLRNLEKTFFINPELNYDLDLYQNKMHRLFEYQPEIYVQFLQTSELIIDEERNQLLERNKQDYESIDDLVHDILMSLLLKTRISCIPNEEVRNIAIEDGEAAIELAKTKIDKRALKKANKLNNKYTIKDRNK